MYAFIFVVLVVMIFLGRWRATFIICLTIPVSLICSFIYLYAVGSTLNIISLSSMESRRRTSRSVSSSCVPQCFMLSPYFLWKMPRRMPRPMLQSLASCAR